MSAWHAGTFPHHATPLLPYNLPVRGSHALCPAKRFTRGHACRSVRAYQDVLHVHDVSIYFHFHWIQVRVGWLVRRGHALQERGPVVQNRWQQVSDDEAQVQAVHLVAVLHDIVQQLCNEALQHALRRRTRNTLQEVPAKRRGAGQEYLMLAASDRWHMRGTQDVGDAAASTSNVRTQ